MKGTSLLWMSVGDRGADRGKLNTDAKRARAALEAPDKALDAPRDSSADQSPRPGSTGRSGGPSHRRGGFGIPGFGGSGTNQ